MAGVGLELVLDDLGTNDDHLLDYATNSKNWKAARACVGPTQNKLTGILSKTIRVRFANSASPEKKLGVQFASQGLRP